MQVLGRLWLRGMLLEKCWLPKSSHSHPIPIVQWRKLVAGVQTISISFMGSNGVSTIKNSRNPLTMPWVWFHGIVHDWYRFYSAVYAQVPLSIVTEYLVDEAVWNSPVVIPECCHAGPPPGSQVVNYTFKILHWAVPRGWIILGTSIE